MAKTARKKPTPVAAPRDSVAAIRADVTPPPGVFAQTHFGERNNRFVRLFRSYITTFLSDDERAIRYVNTPRMGPRAANRFIAECTDILALDDSVGWHGCRLLIMQSFSTALTKDVPPEHLKLLAETLLQAMWTNSRFEVDTKYDMVNRRAGFEILERMQEQARSGNMRYAFWGRQHNRALEQLQPMPLPEPERPSAPPPPDLGNGKFGYK